jgi:hypothetical protein
MRKVMTGMFGLMLCLSALGLGAGGAAAGQATPLPALKGLAPANSLLSKVDYRDYCVRQYFKCRHYSDNSWEFRRCMKWRGCWEAYQSYREHRAENSCHHWREACAENWGYGNSDFYGCLRFHGCD